MKVKIKTDVRWAVSPREIKSFSRGNVVDVPDHVGESMMKSDYAEKVTEKVTEKKEEKPKKGKKRSEDAAENKRLDKAKEDK